MIVYDRSFFPLQNVKNKSLYCRWLVLFLRSRTYRIYSNKCRGAYLIFRAASAVLIRGRRLFKHYCTRQMYFFYIFIQRYNFYLLIFRWTDTELIVNLQLREKFTRRKKPETFIITRAKLSGVRANCFVVVEQFKKFSQF